MFSCRWVAHAERPPLQVRGQVESDRWPGRPRGRQHGNLVTALIAQALPRALTDLSAFFAIC